MASLTPRAALITVLLLGAGCASPVQPPPETGDGAIAEPPTPGRQSLRGSAAPVLDIPGLALNGCKAVVILGTVPRALIDLPYDSPWHDDDFQYRQVYNYEFVCNRYSYASLEGGPVHLMLEGVQALNYPGACAGPTGLVILLRAIYTDDMGLGGWMATTLGVAAFRTTFAEPGGSLPALDHVRTWTPAGHGTSTWQTTPSEGGGRSYSESTIFIAHNDTHSSRLHLDYTFEGNPDDGDWGRAAFEKPLILSYVKTDDYPTQHAFRRNLEATGAIDVWSNTQCGP